MPPIAKVSPIAIRKPRVNRGALPTLAQLRPASNIADALNKADRTSIAKA
jgi:hypothetical protein